MYRYKRGRLVEDSTKGNARCDPKTYKGDTPVQVWLDRRRIATITHYLDSLNPGMIRFMSDVLRTVFDIAYEEIMSKGLGKEFDITEAGMYLVAKFRKDLNPCGKGERNLQHNMNLENRLKEQAFKYRTPAVVTTTNTCQVSPDDPLVQVALRAKEQVAKIKEMTKVQDSEKVEEPTEIKPKFPPEYYDENGKLDYNKAMAMIRARAQANAAKVIVPRKPQIDIEREERRKIREQEKALERAERLREKLAEVEAKAGIRSSVNDDRPRPKTDEEIEADYKRIENKDKALFDALDAPAPKPPVD